MNVVETRNISFNTYDFPNLKQKIVSSFKSYHRNLMIISLRLVGVSHFFSSILFSSVYKKMHGKYSIKILLLQMSIK